MHIPSLLIICFPFVVYVLTKLCWSSSGLCLVPYNIITHLQEETDESKNTRRPFDRQIDLQLPQNIVTPAKRQALMKDSASSLKKKFSHGSQRFL